MTSPVSPNTLPCACLAAPSRKSAACRCESRSSNNYDRIPREFREENLKEGFKQLQILSQIEPVLWMHFQSKIIKPEDDAFEKKNYDEQLGDQKP